MQKLILLVTLFTFSAFATSPAHHNLHALWDAWKNAHHKRFTPIEDSIRFAIFIDNYYKVKRYNARQTNVRLSLNKYADLTAEEFIDKHTGCAYYEDDQALIKSNTIKYESFNYPDAVDWRNNNAVTPVKDQGQCGACWTFSTTGVLEGYYAIKNQQLLSFSEQQIIDCAQGAGYGCSGGWPYLGIQYAGTNGIEQESTYPYTGEDGKCQFNQGAATKVNNGYAFLADYSADSLKTGLSGSPVSVLIEADQEIFQFYTSGVIGPEDNCGSTVDHAVLAVGYGSFYNKDAFIVKNSWGESWGENGYVYLSTDGTVNGGAGVCGILSQPVVAN